MSQAATFIRSRTKRVPMSRYLWNWIGVFVLLAAGAAVAPAAGAAPAGHILRHSIESAIFAHAHQNQAQTAAAGRRTTITLQARASGWAYGVAILTAPDREGAYPDGWIFVAEPTASAWQISFDTDASFASTVSRAPSDLVPDAERAIYTRQTATIQSVAAESTNNTTLSLPYAVGQSWQLTGGPHGWNGTDRPFSSIDLSGGDNIVRAPGDGVLHVMCTSTQGGQFGGWLRMNYDNGYATDFYHLWNVTTANGARLARGSRLGDTGTNTCAGGGASGRHVHWTIAIQHSASSFERVTWHWRSAGQWVFWEDPGDAAYAGFAMHGNTRVDRYGYLYNYGSLAANQGIVDPNGTPGDNLREGPGTNYRIIGSASDGTVLTLSCWRHGTSHTGRYGTTDVWDRLTGGEWVSDAFVYTGTFSIGPQC